MTEKTQWVEPPRDHPHIIRARFEVEYAPYFGKAAKGVSEGTSLRYLPDLSRGQEVDLADLRGFVERWSFSNRSFSWLESITFRVRGWELHLTIRGRVSPRDGVQQSYVEPVAFNWVKSIDLTSALASLAGRDTAYLRHWVRQCLRDVVLHEVEESTYYDGVLERDPHAGDPPGC